MAASEGGKRLLCATPAFAFQSFRAVARFDEQRGSLLSRIEADIRRDTAERCLMGTYADGSGGAAARTTLGQI